MCPSCGSDFVEVVRRQVRIMEDDDTARAGRLILQGSVACVANGPSMPLQLLPLSKVRLLHRTVKRVPPNACVCCWTFLEGLRSASKKVLERPPAECAVVLFCCSKFQAGLCRCALCTYRTRHLGRRELRLHQRATLLQRRVP